MRIYKKKPFSSPNSVKVEQLSNLCDRLSAEYDNLKGIRDRISKGEMSEELYDFLNMDGSMENLLCGLPRPNAEISCEGLKEAQLAFIDEALESVAERLMQALKNLWEAFKEWFLDWWDVNRHVRIELLKKQSMFNTNSSVFGSDSSFGDIVTSAYHKPYWERMLDKCARMNQVLRAIPHDDANLTAWIKSNLSILQPCFREFGIEITDGLRIVSGKPLYDRTMTSLRSARWQFNLIGSDIGRTVHILDSELESRKLFGEMERLFTNASIENKAALAFIRQLVMRSKACTFRVADGLRAMLRTAESRAKR